MPFRDVIELPRARIEIEERTGFLIIAESGSLRSIDEVNFYTRQLGEAARRSGCKRAIIDARGEVGDAPDYVRDEMWSWLLSAERPFELIAFVLPTEIAVTRVNMMALAKSAPIRAFESVTAARRWLIRGPRNSTATTGSMQAVTRGSSSARSSQDPSAQDPSAQDPSAQARSAQARSAQARSAQARSAQARSAQARSAQARSAQARSAQARSAPARSDIMTPPGLRNTERPTAYHSARPQEEHVDRDARKGRKASGDKGGSQVA